MGTLLGLLLFDHIVSNQFPKGFVNNSLYTGDIDYVNLPVQGSYWILPITGMFAAAFGITASISRTHGVSDTTQKLR